MPLPYVNKADHSGFETSRYQQKSKTGVSVVVQNGLMSSKTLKNKKKPCALFEIYEYQLQPELNWKISNLAWLCLI